MPGYRGCSGSRDGTRFDGRWFRSNLHRGGTIHEIEVTDEEIQTARTATKALVLEVNSSPGIEGIETATNVDVAGLMIDHVEAQLHSQKPGGQVSA